MLGTLRSYNNHCIWCTLRIIWLKITHIKWNCQNFNANSSSMYCIKNCYSIFCHLLPRSNIDHQVIYAANMLTKKVLYVCMYVLINRSYALFVYVHSYAYVCWGDNRETKRKWERMMWDDIYWTISGNKQKPWEDW